MLRTRAAIALLLAAATCATFSPVLDAGFVDYDDPRYLTENPEVQRGITPASVAWALTATRVSNWHPLTWISHMADWSMHGAEPGGHHATSLALHVANVLLLFLLLEGMTGATLRSAAVAALFGVHPLHVESVAWLSERKDVLSTLLWLLATLAYARWTRSRRSSAYVATAVAMAAGLMAKPTLVTLPFTLLLLDAWPLGRWRGAGGDRPGMALVLEKVPLFALSLASSVVTFLVQRSGGAMADVASRPLAERFARAASSYLVYLRMTVWPSDLAVFHPWPRAGGPGPAVAAGLLLAGATVAVLSALRTRPYLATGWLWYLGTLVPMIGIVQVGEQAYAERYTYVPLIGIFVMVAWGVPDLAAAARSRTGSRGAGAARMPLAVASVAGIAALALVAHRYARVWHDSASLFQHALDVTVYNHVAHQNLGVALGRMGRTDEAIAQFREALRLRPDRRDLRLNLAMALHDQHRTAESLEHYEIALRIDPTHAKGHALLGLALAELGRHDEALPHLSEAVRLLPLDATAHNDLGKVLAALGRTEEARERFAEAARIDPSLADARNNLGRALAKLGRREEAIAEFRRAVAADPALPEAHHNLGLALAGAGRLEEARDAYLQALRLRPGYGLAHANLAACLARLGLHEEAWREVERARELGQAPPAALVRELEARRAAPPAP